MRTESVRTKLDGVQPITWMDEIDFKGRSTKLYGLPPGKSMVDGEWVLEEVIPVPDNLILCDFCNERIEQFPVPVFHGHALCSECYKGIIV